MQTVPDPSSRVFVRLLVAVWLKRDGPRVWAVPGTSRSFERLLFFTVRVFLSVRCSRLRGDSVLRGSLHPRKRMKAARSHPCPQPSRCPFVSPGDERETSRRDGSAAHGAAAHTPRGRGARRRGGGGFCRRVRCLLRRVNVPCPWTPSSSVLFYGRGQ